MKNGFTLIELLAVIVILAIIMLIATPMILNIIKDTKEETNKRSIENYANAVENAIVKYQLKGTKVGEGYYKSSEDGKTINSYITNVEEQISLNIEYEGNSVKCDIIKFNKDNTLHLNKCKVNGEFVVYEYGHSDYICVAAKELTTSGVGYIKDPKDPYKLGTEYICNVNAEQQHTFYVLGVEDDKINLIMDRNILNTGEGTTSVNVNSSNNYGKTYWVSSTDYENANIDKNNCNAYACTNSGPITAMNYLYEATKNLGFVPNINIQYADEGKNYGGVFTFDKNTSIKSLNNDIIQTYSDLKARLPVTKELEQAGCKINSSDKCPSWLINGLEPYSNYPYEKESIQNILGYWTLSSVLYKNVNKNDLAYNVQYLGFVTTGGYCCRTIHDKTENGVRPVISVSYSDIN